MEMGCFLTANKDEGKKKKLSDKIFEFLIDWFINSHTFFSRIKNRS
jgi:hypothetical protein